MLRFVAEDIVWQEVPDEVSLAYTLSGCTLRCPGCHSSDTWNPARGEPLTLDYLQARLSDYQGLITCVVFMGGEWQPAYLLTLLRLVRARQLHTCLYTGFEHVPQHLQQQLTYLKTGPWIRALGGLESPCTNQRFIDLRTGSLLNHRFHHLSQGAHHVKTQPGTN